MRCKHTPSIPKRTSSSGMVWPRKRMPSSGSSSDVSHSMAGMPRMPPMACRCEWYNRMGSSCRLAECRSSKCKHAASGTPSAAAALAAQHKSSDSLPTNVMTFTRALYRSTLRPSSSSAATAARARLLHGARAQRLGAALLAQLAQALLQSE